MFKVQESIRNHAIEGPLGEDGSDLRLLLQEIDDLTQGLIFARTYVDTVEVHHDGVETLQILGIESNVIGSRRQFGVLGTKDGLQIASFSE